MARSSFRGFGILFILVATALEAGAQAPPQFSVAPLSLWLFEEPYITLMNDRGSLAGSIATRVSPSEIRSDAFIDRPGQPRQFLGHLPGGNSASVTDLNENDWIVGVSDTASITMHGVVWDAAGGLIEIGMLPGGNQARPHAINNRNQVVGFSNSATGRQATIWEPGTGIR